MKPFSVVRNNTHLCVRDCIDDVLLSGTVTRVNGSPLFVLAGWDENGKEHVSVSLLDQRKVQRGQLPTWDDMAYIKDMFWEDEEEVVQFHPPKSCYIDIYHVLHLWRAKDGGEIHSEGYEKPTQKDTAWHKPDDMLPELRSGNGWYEPSRDVLVTAENNKVDKAFFCNGKFYWRSTDNPIKIKAWMYLPEPYGYQPWFDECCGDCKFAKPHPTKSCVIVCEKERGEYSEIQKMYLGHHTTAACELFERNTK